MALIDCPECGTQVSSKAASCPKCGYPIALSVREAYGTPVTDSPTEHRVALERDLERYKSSAHSKAGSTSKKPGGTNRRLLIGVPVLLLVLLITSMGDDEDAPSRRTPSAETSDEVETVGERRSQSRLGLLCATDPARFVSQATGIPVDRIEITECDETSLTVYAYPRDRSTLAGEHLSKLLPALVRASYLTPQEPRFIHFKVAERGRTVTGASGARIISRAMYDFVNDTVDWTGGR